MQHVGLDVHTKHTDLCALDDETGEITQRHQVATGELATAIASIPGEKVVALETGRQSWFVARELQTLPQTTVHVVDAFRSHRALDGMHRGRKNNKLDAWGLAYLCYERRAARMAVWLVDSAGHDLRTLTRTYVVMVRQSTAVRNRIRSLLTAHGMACEATDLTGVKGQCELQAMLPRLPKEAQFCLLHLNELLLHVKAGVTDCHKRVEKAANGNSTCQLLQSIGGCGPILAAIIVAEIADYRRFHNAAALRCYAGLTASIFETGDHRSHGKLVKGNGYLKYALVMLADHVKSHEQFEGTRLRRRYYRCLHKHGPQPAHIDLARQLCDIIYAMMRNGTTYTPLLVSDQA